MPEIRKSNLLDGMKCLLVATKFTIIPTCFENVALQCHMKSDIWVSTDSDSDSDSDKFYST